MAAYYNEFDPFAAAWLRELIKAGHIAPGDVDERSITEIKPDDLKGYTQCHFFAGIGGWSHALRLAGWDDARPVWTGSCPCQPFSTAGKGEAQSDERHLWPHWFRLIRESKPAIIFGEQVASAIAQGWLDDAFNDLEAEEYTCAAAVLPALSVGRPHKRDRLWFVGYSKHYGRDGRKITGSDGKAFPESAEGQNSAKQFAGTGNTRNVPGIMGESIRTGLEGHAGDEQIAGGRHRYDQLPRQIPLADSTSQRPSGSGQLEQSLHPEARYDGQTDQSFDDSEGLQWIECPDGKARPVKPGIRLLAHGVSGRVAIRRTIGEGQSAIQEEKYYSRVGTLRGFGNAIPPEVGAEFIIAADGAIT